eukprot:TRINITY_DN77690_c0_g1_i1.p2 TRINITY_DN77690_c0_g1~~TRINITY_DN77690_c0_g1_i1.p2  ORF type:complete len:109 (-),score=26.55 TRINITY_DN77690_c0_g1_i1:198-524(-)
MKGAFAEAGVQLTAKEVSHMMDEADADGNGLIDLAEFTDVLMSEVDRWNVKTSSVCALLSVLENTGTESMHRVYNMSCSPKLHTHCFRYHWGIELVQPLFAPSLASVQ